MGWFDDALDWVDDNVIDPMEDSVDDAVDWVDDNVINPIEDSVDDVVDWVDDNITDPFIETVEDFGEWIEDTIEEIGENIEDRWDDFTETLGDLWGNICDTASDVWDSIVYGAESAWEWLEEKTKAAIDWLLDASEAVLNFIVEDLIPFIVAAVELIVAFVKVIGALFLLPLCYVIQEMFGDEEATILEGIKEHSPRLMEEFNIVRLPSNGKYVVFSDQHMFVDGDMNFFKNNKNAEIYHFALEHYSNNGFSLIEAGDVEDFWMRNGVIKANILLVSENLPWPYFSDTFEASAFLSANQVHAINVFLSNATTYARIKSLFCDHYKYVRLIGNHDDVWADSSMKEIFDLFYPGEKVYDYCTLDAESTRSAEVIISHGHQSDIFNTPMCNFAGKVMTEFATKLYEISFSEWNLFTTPESEWDTSWDGLGFENKLQDTNIIELVSFSEVELYKDLENIYGDYPHQPYIILGHTHRPKDNARIPKSLVKNHFNWNEYSNSGTTGMWQNIVFGLEIEYPDIQVVAWKYDAATTIKRYELNCVSGSKYLKVL